MPKLNVRIPAESHPHLSLFHSFAGAVHLVRAFARADAAEVIRFGAVVGGVAVLLDGDDGRSAAWRGRDISSLLRGSSVLIGPRWCRWVGLGGINSVHVGRDIKLPVSPSVKMCSSKD